MCGGRLGFFLMRSVASVSLPPPRRLSERGFGARESPPASALPALRQATHWRGGRTVGKHEGVLFLLELLLALLKKLQQLLLHVQLVIL